MVVQEKIFGSFAVKDLAETKKFYSGILGLKLQDNPMGILEINTGKDYRTIIYPKPDHKPANFTVLNLPVRDIGKAVDELAGKGVEFEKYEGDLKTDKKGIHRAEGGPLIAWFKDPSGNILSIVQV